jgi:hypothetical protein
MLADNTRGVVAFHSLAEWPGECCIWETQATSEPSATKRGVITPTC